MTTAKIEAVLFSERGVWHAIVPDVNTGAGSDYTYCGRFARTAVRMWEDWAEHKHFRCQVCERALEKRDPTTYTGSLDLPEAPPGPGGWIAVYSEREDSYGREKGYLDIRHHHDEGDVDPEEGEHESHCEHSGLYTAEYRCTCGARLVIEDYPPPDAEEDF
jgi:hypothetical protein